MGLKRAGSQGRMGAVLGMFAIGALPLMQAQAAGIEAIKGPSSGASIAPDGKRVAYARKTPKGWRIYVSALDGSGAKQISQGPRDDLDPAWRADGAAIAFASNRGGNFDLFSVRPDGGNLRQLTRTKQDERSPQWSPRPFGLFHPYDIDYRTQVGRSKGNIAPSDLKLLDLLSKNSTSWEGYKAKFDVKAISRYYKLLFVEGTGDGRRVATMRENGAERQTLDTGMKGAHFAPAWERAANLIAFARNANGRDLLYTADYPVTTDLKAGQGKSKFGIEVGVWRRSIRRAAETTGLTGLTWTPNGDYIVAVSGVNGRLLPRPDSGLKPATFKSTVGAVVPSTTSWQPDARTLFLTVRQGTGTALRAYKFNTPLIDILNINDFSDGISSRERGFLQRNGFVAAGSPMRQMYHVYETTDYENLPIFVTTDSLLHMNHLVFDYLLRGAETDHMMPAVLQLCEHYLRTSLQQSRQSGAVGASAQANTAFFAVAARLALGAVKTGKIDESTPVADDVLDSDRRALRDKTIKAQQAKLVSWTSSLETLLKQVPDAVNTVVAQELKLIEQHGGMSQSPIFGGALTGTERPSDIIMDTRIDYGDFVPRGHYTRSEILRRYFLITRWLSGAPFRRDEEGVRRSLLIAAATDTDTRAKLDKALSVVSSFVGEADDADIASYSVLWRELNGGANPSIETIADANTLNRFVERVQQLPQPRIAVSRGAAFRFWPQPYTIDGEIMQSLVYDDTPPDVGTESMPRYFALGLDVMGVLGSQRARQILDRTKFQGTFFDFDLKETEYENYNEQFDTWRNRIAALPVDEWHHNLYTRTLFALQPLLKPTPTKYAFTKSAAWTDKNLNAALGTWAELKHDTMPKMPVAIEAGGEGGITEAPLWEQPRGFVEPAPLVLQRLSALVQAERDVLQKAGYLSADAGQRLQTFGSLLTMLTNLERKQNFGQPLTPREIEQLRFYGAYQEHLTLITAEGEGGSMEGNDMAIVADVSSAYSTRLKQQLVLQEGVGRALPIYVAVERNGRRELTKGAVFTYYEFTHPAEDRLTDEKWREVLDGAKAPQPPAWTSSFISRLKDLDE